MRRTLGQPVVVENVTGACGNIGVTRRAAAADGYTVVIGNGRRTSLRVRCIRCRTIPDGFRAGLDGGDAPL